MDYLLVQSIYESINHINISIDDAKEIFDSFIGTVVINFTKDYIPEGLSSAISEGLGSDIPRGLVYDSVKMLLIKYINDDIYLQLSLKTGNLITKNKDVQLYSPFNLHWKDKKMPNFYSEHVHHPPYRSRIWGEIKYFPNRIDRLDTIKKMAGSIELINHYRLHYFKGNKEEQKKCIDSIIIFLDIYMQFFDFVINYVSKDVRILHFDVLDNSIYIDALRRAGCEFETNEKMSSLYVKNSKIDYRLHVSIIINEYSDLVRDSIVHITYEHLYDKHLNNHLYVTPCFINNDINVLFVRGDILINELCELSDEKKMNKIIDKFCEIIDRKDLKIKKDIKYLFDMIIIFYTELTTTIKPTVMVDKKYRFI
jgi:hypothetical protein